MFNRCSELPLIPPEQARIACQAEAAASVDAFVENSLLGYNRCDEDQDFEAYVVEKGEKCIAQPKSYLSCMSPNEYRLALAAPPHTWTSPSGEEWLYTNVLFQSRSLGWQLDHIFCEGCILLGCNAATFELLDTHVEIGIPRQHAEFMMRSLQLTFPESLESVRISDRHYWSQASWGTGEAPCYLVDTESQLKITSDLAAVMAVFEGKALRATMKLAFAVYCKVGEEGPACEGYHLAIQCIEIGVNAKLDFDLVERAASPTRTAIDEKDIPTNLSDGGSHL